jgi:hypothetical protein
MTSDASAASIYVDLEQHMALVRDPKIRYVGATTWEHSGLISNPSAQGIRNMVKDIVDVFLNVWLEVNPRRSSSQN